MAILEDFLPSVQPHCPGCPESIILDAIRDACRRFCTDTWIIKEDIPAGDIDAGIDDYTITPASGRSVVGITSFLYDKREMIPGKTEAELDILDYGWRTADPGVATAITSPEPNRVKLNRVPEATIVGGLITQVATKPTSAATTVDDLLLSDWDQAIKHGALEKLLEIPEKGWSDIKLSLWHGKRFNFQIQRGKARARMGYMKKSTVARNRAWI